jgi:hypothetical protein
MEPPLVSTRRIIRRIAPLQLGKIMGLVYGIFGLIFIPFILLASTLNALVPAQARGGILAMGVGMAVAAPVFYAILGFVFGVIGAFIYNLIAGWVGGIEVEVQ